MSKLQEKIEEFKAKQDEIKKLHDEIEPKRQNLIQEYAKNQEEMQKVCNEKIIELMKPLLDLSEKYRAEMKAEFGITDGEKFNVLQVVELVSKALVIQ